MLVQCQLSIVMQGNVQYDSAKSDEVLPDSKLFIPLRPHSPQQPVSPPISPSHTLRPCTLPHAQQPLHDPFLPFPFPSLPIPSFVPFLSILPPASKILLGKIGDGRGNKLGGKSNPGCQATTETQGMMKELNLPILHDLNKRHRHIPTSVLQPPRSS